MFLDWLTSNTVLLVLASIPVLYMSLKSKKEKTVVEFEEDSSVIPERIPGNGTPLFHGIRVVELSTVVAAPSCAAAMAEHGAEVIKIEDGKGDYWRQFFLEYQKGSTYSNVFQAVNRGKKSVLLNLKDSSNVEILKDILSQADVFITNIRTDALIRLGLDYDTLKDHNSRLIYGHITAWGRDGPDYQLPGFDLGVFWAASGISSLVHKEGHYSTYPTAFGDKITGANLLTGIGLALRHRMLTGNGQLLHTSLFESGLWMIAPNLLHVEGPDTEFPDYQQLKHTNPCYHTYCTKDAMFIGILALGKEKQVLPKLADAFEINTDSFGMDLESIHQLETVMRTKSLTEISKVLDEIDVGYTKFETLSPSTESTDLIKNAKSFVNIPGTDNAWIRFPFDFSCSDEHVPLKRAPEIGQSTKSFLENGWSPRSKEAELDNLPSSERIDPSRGLLSDVKVVELSGFNDDLDVSVSAACCQLVQFGATVYKVEPTSGDPWRTRDAKLFNHLNHGKQSVLIGSFNQDKMFSEVNIFITNLSDHELEDLNISIERLREKYPRLVIVRSSNWHNGSSNNKGSLGAFWLGSGLAAFLTGKFPMAPVNLPSQFGELVHSTYLLTGLCSALFHQTRTGQGQLVTTSMIRTALWSQTTIHAILTAVPEADIIFKTEEENIRRHYPVPTMKCYKTKDGKWIQLLGLPMKKHLRPFLKAFGLRLRVYPRLITTVLFKVLPKKGSVFNKVFPIFELLNDSFELAISKLTWEECKVLFEKHDVWYAPVNTPVQSRRHRQAEHLGVFQEHDGNTFISSPITLGCNQNQTNSLDIVPELGNYASF